MAESGKIAISLPRALLERVEAERRGTGQSRSAFVALAIEQYFRRGALDERVRRYVEGYLRHPESGEEIGAAGRAAADLLAGEPWEA